MADTSLGLAENVLELVVAMAASEVQSIPATRWAQLGMPIMTCASVAVGVVATREIALYDRNIQCGAMLQADLQIGIVRECAIEHDQSGHTDPVRVRAISRELDKDGQILSMVSGAMPGKTTGASITYSVEGGLAMAVMIVTSEVSVW